MKHLKIQIEEYITQLKKSHILGYFDNIYGYMLLASAGAIIAGSVFCLVQYWEKIV